MKGYITLVLCHILMKILVVVDFVCLPEYCLILFNIIERSLDIFDFVWKMILDDNGMKLVTNSLSEA